MTRILQVAAFAAIVAAVTYGIGLLIPPTYRSYETLYFPASSQAATNPAIAALKGNGADAEGGVVPILRSALTSPLVGSGPQTATGIMVSHDSLSRVIAETGLGKHWDLSPMRAERRLRDRLQIKTDQAGFLRIEVEMNDPELAVRVLQSIHKQLERRSGELTLSVSRKNREFVEERLEEAEKVLSEQRAQLVASMMDSPITDLESVQKAYMDARMKLDEARVRQVSAASNIAAIENSLQALMKGRKGYNSDMMALQALGFSSEAESMGKVLTALASELQSRRLSLQDASSKFTQESPEFKEAVASARSAESFTKEVLETQSRNLAQGTLPQLARAKAELKGLESSVASYGRMLENYERSARAAPSGFATVQEARSKFETALQTRAMLQAELEMARIAEVRDPARFELVDAPFVDPDPVAPRKGLMAGFAFVAAFALGLFVTVGRPARRPTELAARED